MQSSVAKVEKTAIATQRRIGGALPVPVVPAAALSNVRLPCGRDRIAGNRSATGVHSIGIPAITGHDCPARCSLAIRQRTGHQFQLSILFSFVRGQCVRPSFGNDCQVPARKNAKPKGVAPLEWFETGPEAYPSSPTV